MSLARLLNLVRWFFCQISVGFKASFSNPSFPPISTKWLVFTLNIYQIRLRSLKHRFYQKAFSFIWFSPKCIISKFIVFSKSTLINSIFYQIRLYVSWLSVLPKDICLVYILPKRNFCRQRYTSPTYYQKAYILCFFYQIRNIYI